MAKWQCQISTAFIFLDFDIYLTNKLISIISQGINTCYVSNYEKKPSFPGFFSNQKDQAHQTTICIHFCSEIQVIWKQPFYIYWIIMAKCTWFQRKLFTTILCDGGHIECLDFRNFHLISIILQICVTNDQVVPGETFLAKLG